MRSWLSLKRQNSHLGRGGVCHTMQGLTGGGQGQSPARGGPGVRMCKNPCCGLLCRNRGRQRKQFRIGQLLGSFQNKSEGSGGQRLPQIVCFWALGQLRQGNICPECGSLVEEVGVGGCFSGLVSLHLKGKLSFIITESWLPWGRGQSPQSQQDPKMSELQKI